ncbi:unnamed protein product [Lupinus luteus]|uniref:Uncharacterized protein n=1 Tax=Lupinus luteus TaxID=3873 RepID=A0AAV1XEC7_LUPLU
MESHMQCDLKAKECYETWISLTETNEQLVATQMELDKMTFKSLSIDQTLEKQAENLRSISSRYELDKKKWQQISSHWRQSCLSREHPQVYGANSPNGHFFHPQGSNLRPCLRVIKHVPVEPTPVDKLLLLHLYLKIKI